MFIPFRFGTSVMLRPPDALHFPTCGRWKKKKKHVAKCSAFVGRAVTPSGLPRQPVSHISARLNTFPAALDDWLGHLCISGPGCFGKARAGLGFQGEIKQDGQIKEN